MQICDSAVDGFLLTGLKKKAELRKKKQSGRFYCHGNVKVL